LIMIPCNLILYVSSILILQIAFSHRNLSTHTEKEMNVEKHGELKSRVELIGFLSTLLDSKFSGFIDFDFGKRLRRLLMQDGEIVSAQSNITGENFCDFLLAQKYISAPQVQQVIAVAKQKRIPLETCMRELQILSGENFDQALSLFAREMVQKCLVETSARYQLIMHANLAATLQLKMIPIYDLLEERKEEQNNLAKPWSGKNLISSQNQSSNPDSSAPQKIKRALAVAKTQNVYERLGVKENASIEEIRTHYFDLAKNWHTDRFASVDLGNAKESLDLLFGLIADAFNTLSNDNRRKEYDVFLDRQRRGLPTDLHTIVNSEAVFKRGEALLKRGEYEEALTALTEAVQLNPAEADFHATYGLALYLSRGGNSMMDAISALQKALAIQPKLARANEYLGRIYRLENNFTQAKEHFTRCLELDPRNITAQRELRLMSMRTQNESTHKTKGLLARLFKR